MNNNADLNSYICILLVSNMAGTIQRYSLMPSLFGQGTCDKPVENVCLSLLIYSLCISLWGGIRWRSTAYISPIYICVYTAVKKCWTYFNDPQNKSTYQVCLPAFLIKIQDDTSHICVFVWTCFGIYLDSFYLTCDTSCYCCLACQIITSGSPEFPLRWLWFVNCVIIIIFRFDFSGFTLPTLLFPCMPSIYVYI